MYVRMCVCMCKKEARLRLLGRGGSRYAHSGTRYGLYVRYGDFRGNLQGRREGRMDGGKGGGKCLVRASEGEMGGIIGGG